MKNHSTESVKQLTWVQTHLKQIQDAYKKTLFDAPHLQEIINDFTELTVSLFTIAKQAIQLSQLIHSENAASQIGIDLADAEKLLSEVEQTKEIILNQVNHLIEYYNRLADLTSQISGKENTKLPHDTVRYMKTLQRYIHAEHQKTEKQLIQLKNYSKSEFQSIAQISEQSDYDHKKRYLDIQSILGRVVKCYIALAGHTQVNVNPITKSAQGIIELEACPTCHLAITIFRVLAPSFASYTLKNFINKQFHILFMGCSKKVDSEVINGSIIYNALFEEIRNLETLDHFWKQFKVKIHQNEIRRGFENQLLASDGEFERSEIWDILRFLVHAFPTQKDFGHGKWESLKELNSNLGGLKFSVQFSAEGKVNAIIRKSGIGLFEEKK